MQILSQPPGPVVLLTCSVRCQGPSAPAACQPGQEFGLPESASSNSQPLINGTRSIIILPPHQSGWLLEEVGMGSPSSCLCWHATRAEGPPIPHDDRWESAWAVGWQCTLHLWCCVMYFIKGGEQINSCPSLFIVSYMHMPSFRNHGKSLHMLWPIVSMLNNTGIMRIYMLIWKDAGMQVERC